ncbi:MAG: F0F1 ATP synthase subunit B [Candidatus Liptonbacteria bacterium]|nr:F0F1 ATP synthase subunit B [Candidatus Liptonbacteria bacterium]
MSELIHNFGIDWKLLLAQVVNFGILLFLLRRFAYRPILAILRKRREGIEHGLRMSEEAERRLASVDIMKEEVLHGAKEEALTIVSAAHDTAKKRKDEMMYEAQMKAEGVVQEAKRVIEKEKAKMGEVVYMNARELITHALAKVLKKMPQESRDTLLIEEALRELRAIRK